MELRVLACISVPVLGKGLAALPGRVRPRADGDEGLWTVHGGRQQHLQRPGDWLVPDGCQCRCPALCCDCESRSLRSLSSGHGRSGVVASGRGDGP